MLSCAVYGCKNNKRRTVGVKYFRFPTDECMQRQWVSLCGCNVSVRTARICSIHFDEDAYHKSLQERLLNYSPVHSRKLKKDAVPTLYLPGSECKKDVARQKRLEKRTRKKLVDELLMAASDDKPRDAPGEGALMETVYHQQHIKRKRSNGSDDDMKLKRENDCADQTSLLLCEAELHEDNEKEPSSGCSEDMEIALLQLHREKLLLELEKISEERERIAVEKRNILLSSQVLRLRLQKLGLIWPSPTEKVTICKSEKYRGRKESDFIPTSQTDFKTEILKSYKSVPDDKSSALTSASLPLGPKSDIPAVPIQLQLSSGGKIPATFQPISKPLITNVRGNSLVMPVAIPNTGSNILTPLLNVRGLTPGMTHLNIVQPGTRVPAFNSPQQIGLIVKKCNPPKTTPDFLKPNPYSTSATNNQHVLLTFNPTLMRSTSGRTAFRPVASTTKTISSTSTSQDDLKKEEEFITSDYIVPDSRESLMDKVKGQSGAKKGVTEAPRKERRLSVEDIR